MKVAVIPDEKMREAKRLISHDRQPERTKVDVVELAKELDELEASIEDVQEYVSQTVYRQLAMMRWTLARVELALEDASVDLDSLDRIDAKVSELKQRAQEIPVQD